MSLTNEETIERIATPLSQGATEQRNAYLTILKGTSVGRTYQLGPGRHIVGRALDCDIIVDDEGVSRRHALFVVSAQGNVVIEDLRSTNGTLINGQRSDVLGLAGGERLQFGSDTVFKFEFRDPIEEQFATHLYESATQDHLTGVFNERFLRDQLVMEFAWHSRHKFPLSLIFIDIDHFKQVNDDYGHLIGDAVLRDIAACCEGATRTEDVFARYGGEEFACLLRKTTTEGATIIAERMRRAVEEHVFEFSAGAEFNPVRVTISAGIAEIGEDTDDPQELLAAADRRLYQAKRDGRNRVESNRRVEND
jgi:diguanylate cyclase (GGDEF)-like protein